MNLFLYLDKVTLLHKLDPRSKLFILLISFVIPLLFQHPYYEFAILILVLFYGVIGKALRNLQRVKWLLILIALFSIVLWSIYAKGEQQLFWRISYESVLYGISVAIKINVMLMAGIFFLSTTKNEEIALGLQSLGLPYVVCFAFSTALRLVPTFLGTAVTVISAQKSRGLDLDSGSLLGRFKKYIPLLTPIILSTIRSSEGLSMALESKGFNSSSKKRSSLLELKFTYRDALAIIFALVLLSLAIVLNINQLGKIPGLTF